MMQPGRSYSAGSQYRYGFNGKEKDRESPIQYDYGFRIYDPRVSRFKSSDPLTKKYPELTPYQFASNTPIQAIDLDGLEAFFIHGTSSDNSRWINHNDNKQARENTNQLLRISGNRTYNATFEWGSSFLNYGNGPSNNKADRKKAAIALVNHILTTKNSATGKMAVDGTQDITLIGHSHGGNVAIQAVPLLRKELDKIGLKNVKINLITIATPADNAKGSIENPATYGDIINEHIQIYNDLDVVQSKLSTAIDYFESFDRRYEFDKTKNTKINVDKYYKKEVIVGVGSGAHKTTSTDGVGAHSVDYDHPEVLKENIDNGNIPTIKPKI